MSVKLLSSSKIGVSPKDARDGQICEIIKSPLAKYVGIIVQIAGNKMLQVGEGRDYYWSDIDMLDDKFLLRPLKNGTHLIIEDNE